MAKGNQKSYNLKPQETLTPEFYNICINNAHIASTPIPKENFKTEQEYQKYFYAFNRTLGLNFYINPSVDIQSILKVIVLLTGAKDIRYLKSETFSPTNVSIDSILNHKETVSYTYEIYTDNCFDKSFMIKIYPKELRLTTISIKARPYQVLVALQMIYFLGGYIKEYVKKDIKRSKMFDGFSHVKYSQQGRWKNNFAKADHPAFLVSQKDSFFKKIKPIAKEEALKLYDGHNSKVFTPEHLEFLYSKETADQ